MSQGRVMAVERVSQIENEALYGLLAMADHFMSANPQRIPEALQCWIASLSLSPPAASLRSLTCCKIGLTLYHHTSNIEEAKAYLNQAVSVLALVEGTLYMWIIYLSRVMTCTQIGRDYFTERSGTEPNGTGV